MATIYSVYSAPQGGLIRYCMSFDTLAAAVDAADRWAKDTHHVPALYTVESLDASEERVIHHSAATMGYEEDDDNPMDRIVVGQVFGRHIDELLMTYEVTGVDGTNVEFTTTFHSGGIYDGQTTDYSLDVLAFLYLMTDEAADVPVVAKPEDDEYEMHVEDARELLSQALAHLRDARAIANAAGRKGLSLNRSIAHLHNAMGSI